jgi:hypothetical protein
MPLNPDPSKRTRLHSLLKNSSLDALYQGTTSQLAEKLIAGCLVSGHGFTAC